MKILCPLIFGLMTTTTLATSALAQITVDGTTNTSLTPLDNGVQIDNGDRAGGNLFHSFGEFSVPTGSEAFFNNASDIVNIFSRVTGGNISNIDGLLRANGAANLFMINPAGIIFGENASLNIGGSFYGSTADSIIFSNGEFSATDLANPPLITINAPLGLGIRDNTGDIATTLDPTGQSFTNLTVNPGQSINLVGGNINLNGASLNAPGGTIELGGLAASGEVGIKSDGSLSFPEDVFRADVSLNNVALVNVISNNGGSVIVNARNLEILGGSSILAGIILGNQQADAQAGDIVINATDQVTIAGDANSASVITNVVGDVAGANFISSQPTQGNAGNILINADKLEGTGSFIIASVANGEGNAGQITISAKQSVLLDGELGAGITSLVGPSALGNGSDITITTPSLSISNNVGLLAVTVGQGNAGNIIIEAENGDIVLDNNSVLSTSVLPLFAAATGQAGDINIKADSLSLASGARLNSSTLSEGNAGTITINATDSVSFDSGDAVSNVAASGVGTAGGINITTSNLSLTNGGQLSASTRGRGDAGNVTVNAKNIFLDGQNNNGFPSAIFSTVEATGVGTAGGINLTTSNLSLTNGGQLLASTRGEGDAGNVTVNANSIFLDGEGNNGFPSAIFSRVGDPNQSVIPVGNAGGIELNTNSLSVNNGAQLSASTYGEGNAGTFTINAAETVSFDGGFAFSTVEATGVGTAGGINLTTSDLSLTNGGQLLAITQGRGDAGSITIETGNLTISDDSLITASTFGNGDGGNIILNVNEDITLRDNSFISARALEDANGGNLNIDARFIIAFPSQGNGNDIVATAERGNGGNININSRQIFNLQEGNAIDSEGNFLPNNSNDIDASSQTEGLDGTVAINTPDVDPLRGATELPTNPVSAETIANNACSATVSSGQQISLIVKGKGGIP
ncbi:MAG: filamentous hemagglutinin N-terminal domain-containing protein, partial [Xenococcus sp. (in: cyanobacteria)]